MSSNGTLGPIRQRRGGLTSSLRAIDSVKDDVCVSGGENEAGGEGDGEGSGEGDGVGESGSLRGCASWG